MLTFFTRKANHDWKSLMSSVFISKPLTAGDLTSGTKVLPLFALKSAGAKRKAIELVFFDRGCGHHFPSPNNTAFLVPIIISISLPG
jgi:hypothetical protein